MTMLIPRRLKSRHTEWRREDAPKCPGGVHCHHDPMHYTEPKTKEETPVTKRGQTGGGHYDEMAIQPIDFIHANKLTYEEGNVVKYVVRHRRKNGAEDIQKAIDYLTLILELDYGQGRADKKVQDFEDRIEAVNKSHSKMMDIITDICACTGLHRAGKTMGSLTEAISEYVDAEIQAHT